MTREETLQRMTALVGATVPIVRQLQGNGEIDSVTLLRNIDQLGNAYHLALSAGMQLAYAVAASENGREARPYGVGENGL